MRLISFALTADAIRARTKTVTRRLGWQHLQPGERLQACLKVMGRKPGEPVVRLAIIEVLNVRRESLHSLTHGTYTARMARRECQREGFPHLSPRQFVEFFCHEMKCPPDTVVTRIEFAYMDDAIADAVRQRARRQLDQALDRSGPPPLYEPTPCRHLSPRLHRPPG